LNLSAVTHYIIIFVHLTLQFSKYLDTWHLLICFFLCFVYIFNLSFKIWYKYAKFLTNFSDIKILKILDTFFFYKRLDCPSLCSAELFFHVGIMIYYCIQITSILQWPILSINELVLYLVSKVYYTLSRVFFYIIIIHYVVLIKNYYFYNVSILFYSADNTIE